MPSAPAPADEVASDIHARLLPLATAAGVELQPETMPARVGVSRRRLEQLWVNLIRNALRAVSDGGGGEIVSFIRPGDEGVEVGVEDDGPGLDDDDERVLAFDRFYRGSSGRKAGEGSGLASPLRAGSSRRPEARFGPKRPATGLHIVGLPRITA